MDTLRPAVFVLFCLTAVPCRASDDFLIKSSATHEVLLKDLEAVLGFSSIEARIPKLTARILPMFLSLPKRSSGLLSHATVHYALHRINVDQHGWTINGEVPTQNSTIVTFLNDFMPKHILAIFEQHIRADGFGMEDLVILASTVEYFVHDDQKGYLRKICEAMDLPTVGHMSDLNMRGLSKAYLAMFLQYISAQTLREGLSFAKLSSYVQSNYPGWNDAAQFIDDELETFAYTDKDVANPFRARESSMGTAMRLVEKVADEFTGKHAEVECQEIKEDLLEYERADTGRLVLADFYRAGLNATFFYTESKEYLRAMGALDETDLNLGPKVIVPNYVLSKSNCLASYHTYSICCVNECENLYGQLGQLERSIAAPESSPGKIVSLVTALSTSTTRSQRTFSHGLLSRLDDIAHGHGGKVVLHSRLFAQWMHQAFPRECPYPHLAGTTSSLPGVEWSDHTGISHKIYNGRGTRINKTNELIKKLERQFDASLNASDQELADVDSGELMWTSEDEFVEPRQQFSSRFLCSMAIPVLSIVFVALALTLKRGALHPSGGKTQVAAHDRTVYV